MILGDTCRLVTCPTPCIALTTLRAEGYQHNNFKVQDEELMKGGGYGMMEDMWQQTMQQDERNVMEEDNLSECYHAQTHAGN